MVITNDKMKESAPIIMPAIWYHATEPTIHSTSTANFQFELFFVFGHEHNINPVSVRASFVRNGLLSKFQVLLGAESTYISEVKNRRHGVTINSVLQRCLNAIQLTVDIVNDR